MNKTERRNAIATMIYESLDHMYCDNCRFGSEIKEADCEEGMYGCEDCHRKYNGWGISKKEANRLVKQIMDLEKL